MFLQTDEKELGIELQENDRMEDRGKEACGRFWGQGEHAAPLTETQGSQENAFYHSRGSKRSRGAKYI